MVPRYVFTGDYMALIRDWGKTETGAEVPADFVYVSYGGKI